MTSTASEYSEFGAKADPSISASPLITSDTGIGTTTGEHEYNHTATRNMNVVEASELALELVEDLQCKSGRRALTKLGRRIQRFMVRQILSSRIARAVVNTDIQSLVDSNHIARESIESFPILRKYAIRRLDVYGLDIVVAEFQPKLRQDEIGRYIDQSGVQTTLADKGVEVSDKDMAIYEQYKKRQRRYETLIHKSRLYKGYLRRHRG